MTDHPADLDQIRQAAGELIPQLAERLSRSGLGEIEVRDGSLRVRVARAVETAPAAAPAAAQPTAQPTAARSEQVGPATGANHGVPSPAVGYFVYGDGLGPGLSVDKGDVLGFVEVLGVRHDVRAPRRGTVRNLVTETGEAVEYAQTLLELEPVEG